VRRSLIVPVFASVLALVTAQAQKEPEPLRISFKDKTWVLQMAAPGFVVTQNATQPDGRRYLLATNDTSGSVLSVTLEQVTEPPTLEGCKEGFRQRTQPNGPFQLADVKQSQEGAVAVLEYLIHKANGVPLEQMNIFGCLFKEDVYADIHLSKAPSKAADRAQLMTTLSSASFVDIGPAAKSNSVPASSAAFFADGNQYFLRQQFDKAIGPYQEALDLEKKEPKLTGTQWQVLIDNLAMAFGITGKLAASEEVLKYGLSKDPNYAMFYFIRADGYAERDDLTNTMKYLRLALMYKNNVIPGEKLPDPRTDDSFGRFLKNDEFKKLAAEFE
jgi:tetratricopeptide (TPR) repeat protein